MYTGRSGYIYDKIRRLKSKNNNENSTESNYDEIDDDENGGDENNAMDLPESLIANDDNTLMQYFKNCVVNQNQAELREKLKNSVEFRRALLKNPEKPIYKLFPFYFVDPTLVNRYISASEMG